MKHGKKRTALLEKLDLHKLYTLDEAISLVKENKLAEFDETVEIHMKLGVDPRHSDQMIRGTVVLPNGIGKEVKVAVIAKGEKVKEAEEAGADFAGSEELVEKIKGGWFDFDTLIATPDMMSEVGKLGRILGPKKLMPSPKTGTVTFDIANAVKEAKAGKVQFRVDKGANLHAPIGKVSFSSEQLLENAKSLIEAVVRAKPATAKGQFIKSITIASTMSPGYRVNQQQATTLVK
ncbi:MAG: 50S ribosomal protein L1 [candidate division Zixibacteria bacterium 4484_93]|nr:MAG: 50S ribosomal protein L1 [candidate division Zixibacteria bacterium 4484_93]RKZ33612.1 MAG: 50S ribosomal protein L1 [bacterium]